MLMDLQLKFITPLELVYFSFFFHIHIVNLWMQIYENWCIDGYG